MCIRDRVLCIRLPLASPPYPHSASMGIGWSAFPVTLLYTRRNFLFLSLTLQPSVVSCAIYGDRFPSPPMRTLPFFLHQWLCAEDTFFRVSCLFPYSDFPHSPTNSFCCSSPSFTPCCSQAQVCWVFVLLAAVWPYFGRHMTHVQLKRLLSGLWGHLSKIKKNKINVLVSFPKIAIISLNIYQLLIHIMAVHICEFSLNFI